MFISICIGVAVFIVYQFLQRRDSDLNKPTGGTNTELQSHYDWSVHDSWSSGGSSNKQGAVWSKSGGIWSKSQPPPPTEKVKTVWVKGEFVPGEHEVPNKHLGHGHSPMK